MTATLIYPPFGRDTSCTRRVRAGRLVSGATLVGEAAFRRLTTERGQLEYDPNYGLGLAGMLNAEMSATELAAIPGRVANELAKDDRIDSVSTTVTKTDLGGGAWAIDLDIECQTAAGPFALTVRVADVTVSLLRLEST